MTTLWEYTVKNSFSENFYYLLFTVNIGFLRAFLQNIM